MKSCEICNEQAYQLLALSLKMDKKEDALSLIHCSSLLSSNVEAETYDTFMNLVLEKIKRKFDEENKIEFEDAVELDGNVIYEKISNYCKEHKISISRLEVMCGIGNGVIGRWKNDSSRPNIETLSKISRITGISEGMWCQR